MNKEQQRIAIAEACCLPWFYDGKTLWTSPHMEQLLPDYLNDLNAMHEAEKVLTDEQYAVFRQKLNLTFPSPFNCRLESATAEQRAEAFLKTIGKWVE